MARAVHKSVKPPPVCPACLQPQNLEPLGYYGRCVTSSESAKVLDITVRRFRCRSCGVSVSLLPKFAQPYRLIRNDTVQAYFDGKQTATDVQRWSHLLRHYWRRFCRWFPELLALTGMQSRLPPSNRRERSWRQFSKLWGPLVLATPILIRDFCVTPFGRYRCHQVPRI
jgi:hypothetical protein